MRKTVHSVDLLEQFIHAVGVFNEFLVSRGPDSKEPLQTVEIGKCRELFFSLCSDCQFVNLDIMWEKLKTYMEVVTIKTGRTEKSLEVLPVDLALSMYLRITTLNELAWREQLLNIFKTYDYDESGDLELSEFQVLMKECYFVKENDHTSLTEHEIARLFSHFTENSEDGNIDGEMFIQLAKFKLQGGFKMNLETAETVAEEHAKASKRHRRMSVALKSSVDAIILARPRLDMVRAASRQEAAENSSSASPRSFKQIAKNVMNASSLHKWRQNQTSNQTTDDLFKNLDSPPRDGTTPKGFPLKPALERGSPTRAWSSESNERPPSSSVANATAPTPKGKLKSNPLSKLRSAAHQVAKQKKGAAANKTSPNK